MLDAAGRDLVFLETVGTGQSEIEVIGVADTVVLVLMPGSGDSVQALKAGIMEIPDVIVVNKKDHPAAKTMPNVRSILALDMESDWKPPIVLTEAVTGEGAELWEKIAGHRAYLEADGLLDARRQEPRGRGFHGRIRPREDPPGAGGRGRSGAAPPARRGATPGARSPDGGPGNNGAGVQG